MMSSTSKPSGPKSKKFKFIPKTKRQRQVKQPSRNWLELPEDVMANILSRIGVHDILENAPKVCKAWRNICKDPAMWRVIYLDARHLNLDEDDVQAMCKHAVNRSQGQLIDITMVEFCDDELLQYVADRSSQLRRLEIASRFAYMFGSWTKALKKFPLLEELSLYSTDISKEVIETAGRYCPMLKTLKLNQEEAWLEDDDEEFNANEIAIAIGENLHELEHLEVVGESMSNIGLLAILDGCRHLKSLDLRQCLCIDLNGDVGKRCSEQIKCLKLPNDSLKGCPYLYESDSEIDHDDSDDSDYYYNGYLEHDDFTAYNDYDFIDDLF